MGWLKRFNTPVRVEEKEAAPPPTVPSLLAMTAAQVIAIDVLSGPESSLLDKAAFMAYPYVVAAVATAGAEAGVRKWADQLDPADFVQE